MEGCSETEIIKFEKVGCLQALFGLGAASGPRDFKSRVSTYSTTPADRDILAPNGRCVKEESGRREAMGNSREIKNFVDSLVVLPS